MNLKRCALLLMAAMLTLAGIADSQRAQSTSKTKPADPSALPAHPAPAEPQKEGEVPRITVEELKAELAKNAPVFIIDSRSPGSYDNSEIKIKGAVRIPMDEVESRLGEIPHDREIVVYCT
jgi:3-mercaptopyruvate sulfurtransferase SseA